MKQSGIQTSIHYPPIHKFSVFSGTDIDHLALTEEVASRELTLPLFASMSHEQLQFLFQGLLPSYGAS
jgi:dTDP-4-amino-4,6-dideoxygalactose transaminase